MIKKTILFWSVLFLCFRCFAVEFFDTQKDFSSGNFRVSTYLGYGEFYSKFQNVDTQKILLDFSGNVYQYFSIVTKEYNSKTLFKVHKISFAYKPKFIKNVFISTKIGSLYDKDVYFENSSQKLSSDGSDNNFGINIDGSIGYLIFPETFVSPSVIGTANVSYYGFNFNKLNNAFSTNSKFTLFDYSAGISVTKKMSLFLYPYVGAKLILRNSELVDIVNNYKIKGENFLFTINFGNMIYITKKICLNIEYSWSIKGYLISFGLLIPNITLLED